MRKLFAIGAAVVALGISTAGEANADSAMVITADGVCQTLDGNGNSVVATDGHVLLTHSENGNLLLRCKVNDVAPPPDGGAVRWSYENFPASCGFLSALSGVTELTTRWWVQVSASGNSTIVCQFPDY